MVRVAHGHKFCPHLPARVKTTHTGASHEGRIVNDLPSPNSFRSSCSKKLLTAPPASP